MDKKITTLAYLLTNNNDEDFKKASVIILYLYSTHEYSLLLKVFKKIDEECWQRVVFELARTDVVTKEQLTEVVAWFNLKIDSNEIPLQGGIQVIHKLLNRVLGKKKTLATINQLTSSLQITPFDFIKRIDNKQLANLLEDEMNQTIALVCAYIGEEKAEKVLNYIPFFRRHDIYSKIERISSVSPTILRQVERVIERKLSMLVSENFTKAGGKEYVKKMKATPSTFTIKTLLRGKHNV